MLHDEHFNMTKTMSIMPKNILSLLRFAVIFPFALGFNCSFISFVPFTLNGTPAINPFNARNLGFSHMAAALIAIEHFNTRNPEVVPELNDEFYQNCDVMLECSRFFDTEMVTHKSTQTLQKEVFKSGIPCALAGGFTDLPAEILSSFAASFEIPAVISRTFNARVSHDFFSPFTSQVYPDQSLLAEVLFKFLQYKERNNFIALLYSLRDSAVQIHETVKARLEANGTTYASYPFTYSKYDSDPSKVIDNSHSVKTSLTKLKKEGFRTIVCIMEFPDYEVNLLAQAASELGINGEEYFWIFLGVDLSAFSLPPIDVSETNLKFLAGGAMLTPLEGVFAIDSVNSSFLNTWKSQNGSLVALANSYSHHYAANQSYFQEEPLEFGTGFMFDTIMSLGIGACLAAQNRSTLSGYDHLTGVRSVNFTGASGRILLNEHGLRNPSHITYAIINLFHLFAGEYGFDAFQHAPQNSTLYQITDLLEGSEVHANTTTWIHLAPFVYSGGRYEPPKLLRNEPEMNYLSYAVRVAGLTLMTILLLSAIVSCGWVYKRRNHQVLRAAQPRALGVICFGAFVSAWAIFPLSFDENAGWTQIQLDRACMSIPWLISSGHILTYGALFSKLWRVNRVLQFHRAKVNLSHVAWPAALLFFLALVLLSVFTTVAPLEFQRVVIDESTGESIGRCNSDMYDAFLWPIALIMFIPTLLTGIMAWKTADVDERFSDSYWVSVLIIVQIEVILLGVPVVIILREVSTNGRYFGVVMILWTVPASAICLIIVPKVMAYRRFIRDGGVGTHVARGSGGTGQTKVSGVSCVQEEGKPPRIRDSAGSSKCNGSANRISI